MPMMCNPLPEDLFAGVGWNGAGALIALEKIRNNEELDLADRQGIINTREFINEVRAAPPNSFRGLESAKRYRLFWMAAPAGFSARLEELSRDLGDLWERCLCALMPSFDVAARLDGMQEGIGEIIDIANRCRPSAST